MHRTNSPVDISIQPEEKGQTACSQGRDTEWLLPYHRAKFMVPENITERLSPGSFPYLFPCLFFAPGYKVMGFTARRNSNSFCNGFVLTSIVSENWNHILHIAEKMPSLRRDAFQGNTVIVSGCPSVCSVNLQSDCNYNSSGPWAEGDISSKRGTDYMCVWSNRKQL